MIRFEPFSESYRSVADELTSDVICGELRTALKTSDNEDVLALIHDGECVGLALAARGRTSFIHVYILPRFRGHGLGTKAVRALEAQLAGGEAARFMAAYTDKTEAFSRFAEGLGYKRSFASAYMEYRGARFDEDTLPMRQYRDDDYNTAFPLYARAFHEMRLRVGCFPNSVQEPESERTRAEWRETAGERYIYELDGRPAAVAHIANGDIGSIAVACELQGRGIGRRFMKRLCNTLLDEGAKSVTLYCVVGNRARELYDSLGFKALSTDVFAVKEA